MSVYNGAKYLHEAIESILHQTFTDFEFIIINDGSADDSEKIILAFKDERIVYINNGKNLGLIDSLNKGLKVAKGKFIARMDADDIAMPERFEEQVNAFNLNSKAIVIGSDYYLLSEKKLRYIKTSNDSDYLKPVLFFSPCFCHPTVMMKNIFNKESVFYNKDYVFAEDYQLWTVLSSFGEFLNIQKPLLKYRSHALQVSTQNKEKQLAISWKIREEYLEKLHFTLSDEQFETVNSIGNNTFITSVETLKKVEMCLLQLKEQNNLLQTFNTHSFNIFLHKFWMDSCGNTNLGLSAYSAYSNSVLSKFIKVSIDQKSKLLAKCLVRKFRKG